MRGVTRTAVGLTSFPYESVKRSDRPFHSSPRHTDWGNDWMSPPLPPADDEDDDDEEEEEEEEEEEAEEDDEEEEPPVAPSAPPVVDCDDGDPAG